LTEGIFNYYRLLLYS